MCLFISQNKSTTRYGTTLIFLGLASSTLPTYTRKSSTYTRSVVRAKKSGKAKNYLFCRFPLPVYIHEYPVMKSEWFPNVVPVKSLLGMTTGRN